MRPQITIKESKVSEHDVCSKKLYYIEAKYPKMNDGMVAGKGATLEEAIADLLESFQYAPDFVARINEKECPKEQFDLPDFIEVG